MKCLCVFVGILLMLGQSSMGYSQPPTVPRAHAEKNRPVPPTVPAAPRVVAPSGKTTPAPVAREVVSGKQAPTSLPTSRPVYKPEEQIVLDFWKAVLVHDYQELFRLVGFPFVSDSKCRVFGDFKGLETYLKTLKIPAQVSVGIPRLVSPSDNKVAPHITRSLSHLAPETADCSDDQVNQLILQAADYPTKFVQIELLVGTEKVPTLMRLSEINGRWVVTGLDN